MKFLWKESQLPMQPHLDELMIQEVPLKRGWPLPKTAKPHTIRVKVHTAGYEEQMVSQERVQ